MPSRVRSDGGPIGSIRHQTSGEPSCRHGVSLRSMPRSSRPRVQGRTAAPRSMDLRRIGCRDKISILFLVRFLMPYMSFCPVAVIVRGVGAVIAPTASG